MLHSWVLKAWQITTDTFFLSLSFPAAPVVVENEEEDVHFSRLMFRDDFLSDQYFGENHPVSIITEKAHFGEGMHRRAFRTKLQAGQVPLLLPGHSCVLKVHNAISYGTKNNDELIQKNFSLAVEVRMSQDSDVHFTGIIFLSQNDENGMNLNIIVTQLQYHWHINL